MSSREMPFAVLSLSRSGSTALSRVLTLDTNVDIAYEPDFGDAWRQPERLRSFCLSLNSTFQGIKHVWDPNGWPFANKSHISTLESLSPSTEWIGVNASLVDCMHKVIFLRRRNQLARIVSDLLGQQTNLWGHCPSRRHSDREAVDYRAQIKSRNLERLDDRIIEWYLQNAFRWEDQIMVSVSDQRKLTVYYEDLFGSDVEMDTRLRRVAEIGEWLGIRIRQEDDRVKSILRPSSKFNDISSYARIPNFQELVSKFGKI
jgi:hypothetical protein